MKKALGIIILGLLVSSDEVKAAEPFVIHKNANSITFKHTRLGMFTRNKYAARHCAQYTKFAYLFYGAKKDGKVIYHCSAETLFNSPSSGEERLWSNREDKKSEVYKKIERYGTGVTKKPIKKSTIEEFKEICTDLGLTLGTSGYVDCVLKLKSDEEKMIMESQRLESEEKIARGKQDTALDKQELEEEKYNEEQSERKQKKYEKCIEAGTSKAICAIELLSSQEEENQQIIPN